MGVEGGREMHVLERPFWPKLPASDTACCPMMRRAGVMALMASITPA